MRRLKRVAVVDSLNVASSARISVPVPGTADIARLVQHHRHEAGLTQAIEKIQAGKPRPNHRDVHQRRTVPGRF